MAAARPKPPAGLGKAGAALWQAVLSDLVPDVEFTAVELRALEQAARCADDIAAMEEAIRRDGYTTTGSRNNLRPHPGLDIVIRLRALEARLLAKLDVEPPAETTPASARARRAAELRHTRKRKAGQA